MQINSSMKLKIFQEWKLHEHPWLCSYGFLYTKENEFTCVSSQPAVLELPDFQFAWSMGRAEGGWNLPAKTRDLHKTSGQAWWDSQFMQMGRRRNVMTQINILEVESQRGHDDMQKAWIHKIWYVTQILIAGIPCWLCDQSGQYSATPHNIVDLWAKKQRNGATKMLLNG